MNPILSERFIEALSFAAKAHRSQLRKGGDIPYISHLMAVSALVIENGGDEDQAIAALLHDAVEDQGGDEMAHRIESSFGARVARIVRDCTDTYEDPKPLWRPRKEAYLTSLPGKPEDSLLVSLADKVHNAAAIRRDLEEHGDKVWVRFNGGREGTLWYYRTLADLFREMIPRPLADELDRQVREIEGWAA